MRGAFVGATPLGLFRASLGALLVVEALELLPDVPHWFSDDGILPRAELFAIVRRDRIAVFDLAGPPWVALILWAALLGSAVALCLGWRARAAAAAAFVAFAGVHERLPQIIDGADNLSRALLFWLMFAPAGEGPSVDARQGRVSGGSPVASGLLRLQVCWVYLCTALHKLEGPRWRDGTAVRYAWGNPHVFSRDWITGFAASPALIRAATWGTLAFELLFPIALLLPARRLPRTRALLLASGVVFHASIFATMRVGMFSWLLPVTYLAFLPPVWFRADTAAGASSRKTWRDAVLVVVFASAVWASSPSVTRAVLPRGIDRGVGALSLWANWSMFAPQPIRRDYFLTVAAARSDGTIVVRDVALRGESPGHRGWAFSRWWKFEEALSQGQFVPTRSWASWWCRESRRRGMGVTRFNLELREREIPAQGTTWEPWRTRRLWQQVCVAPETRRPTVPQEITPVEAARVPHGVRPTATLAPPPPPR